MYDNKGGALAATPFSAPSFESTYDNNVYVSQPMIRNHVVIMSLNADVCLRGGSGIPDYDDDVNADFGGGQLMSAPGAAELGKSVEEEVWFHGQVWNTHTVLS